MTRRGDVLVAAALVVAFLALAAGATRLTYGAEFAPGAGFAPFWLGLAGAALSAYVLVRALRAPRRAAPISRGDLARLTGAVAGLVLAVAAVAPFGFFPPLTAYLLLHATVVERLSLRASLLGVTGTVALIYLVFATFLGVPFPRGPLGV